MAVKPHPGVRVVGKVVHYVRPNGRSVLAEITALGAGNLVDLTIKHAGAPRLLDLPGTTGHNASTPDSVANSIIGDIDIRAKLSLDDINNAEETEFVSKYTTTGNQRSYRFYKQASTSALQLALSANGAAFITVVSTATMESAGFGDSDVFWPRVTFEAGVEIIFYTSTDGSTWIQLGDAVASAVASIFDGTSIVTVGNRVGSASGLIGTMHEAQIFNGIDGTLVNNFNAQDFNGGDSDTDTAVASTGETWTLNGAGVVIRKDDEFLTDVDLLAASSDTNVWYKSSRRHL